MSHHHDTYEIDEDALRSLSASERDSAWIYRAYLDELRGEEGEGRD